VETNGAFFWVFKKTDQFSVPEKESKKPREFLKLTVRTETSGS
jgi:hypothetical protein